MAAELNPCQVLDTLIVKHSNLTKHATTDTEAAKKTLEETLSDKYQEEIQYITQNLSNANNTVDAEQKEAVDKQTQIVFHLTGFGKFGTIIDNPTTHLINNIGKYLDNNANMPSNVSIATKKVLHVSGTNSLKELTQIRAQQDDENTVYVYLHFGVAASRDVLCLECVGYNCANFKGAPDELGWEPVNEMVIKENEHIYHEYHTTLPVDTLQAVLSSKKYGYNVCKSTDPGRYVCNWIFYNSLHLSLNKANEYNMFVHVPQFEQIDQETQCRFARDLIIEIAKLLNWKYAK